jgi:hypothetical protein
MINRLVENGRRYDMEVSVEKSTVLGISEQPYLHEWWLIKNCSF